VKFLSNLRSAWAGLTGKSMDVSALLRGDDLNDGGGASLSNAYQQSVWVYACIQRLGEQLAGVPFTFSRTAGTGEQLIEAGPLVELFKRPHPLQDRFAFWELTAAWLGLRGEVFIVALGSAGEVVPISGMVNGRGSRRIKSLLILSADRMREIVTQSRIDGWHYSGSSQDVMAGMNLLPEEVLHIKRPNPFNPWRGMSPLSVAMLAAQTDYASAQFQKGLMLNNADTGVIITTEQVLSSEQIEQIKGALRERKRKAGTADRPLFLHGGAKVEKPTINAADMQFLENRKFNRQEICAVFGVPQELIGYTEDANRSVSNSARLNFIENTMMPLGDRIEASLETLVQAIDPQAEGWFNWDVLPIMKEAQRARVDTGVKLWAIGVPFNDINENLDLGFEPYPWHAVGYLPFSVARADDLGSESPKEPREDEDPEPDDEMSAEKLMRKLYAAVPKPAHICAPSGSKWLRSIKPSIKAKEGRMRSFFRAQLGRVLDALEKTSPSSSKAYEELFNLANESSELLRRMKPLLIADLEFGGAQLFAESGLVDFTLPPHRATEFLAQRANRLSEVNQATFEQIQSELVEAVANGETFEQRVARVKSVYKEATESRAASIATTETNSAINTGRQVAMEEAGIELKAWSTSNLPDVRASHYKAQADGPIPVNQKFSNGLMYPGDPAGPPGEVINCRCFMYAVLDPEDVKAGAPTEHLDFAAFVARRYPAGLSKEAAT